MVDCRDIALSELMEKALERRKHLAAQRFNYGYHVEAADEPGTVLYTWPHNDLTMETTWRRQMNQVPY